MSGLKTLTWRTLGAAALLFSANAALADNLFNLSTGSDLNKLILDGDESNGLNSGENQGWWSGVHANMESNVSYFVGLYENPDTKQTGLMNNFFVFDISALTLPVTSAVLQLQYFNSFSSGGAASILYSLFDVTTDVAVLNYNENTSWAIYDDLGTGKHYGSAAISTSLGVNDKVFVELNGTGLADLNAAIAAGADHFAIGGTLSFTPIPNETSVPDSANTVLLLGLAAAALRSVRRRG